MKATYNPEDSCANAYISLGRWGEKIIEFNGGRAPTDEQGATMAAALNFDRYVYTGNGPNASDTQYELIGIAKGAGTSKLEQPLHVYRDPVTGQLYYRTADDFAEKMELVHDIAGEQQ